MQWSSIPAFQAGDSGSNPGGGMIVGVKLPSFELSLLFKQRKVNLNMEEEHLSPLINLIKMKHSLEILKCNFGGTISLNTRIDIFLV